MPLYFRGHHVTAKEFRLCTELVRSGSGHDQIDAVLSMTPETWREWLVAACMSSYAEPQPGAPGSPTDDWGGPYAAAVYRTQEQQQADANTDALCTLLKLIGQEGYRLLPATPKRKPKRKPKQKPKRRHARRGA